MTAGLYADGANPMFRATADEVLGLFRNGRDLRADWLSEVPRIPIHDIRRAQPLLFTITYALGRTLLARGLRPAAMLGHSVGELVAGTLAGVIDVSDAVKVMEDRVDRLAATPPGGMLTVAAGDAQIRPFLNRHSQVSIGALNSPRQVVLSGLDAPLDDLAAELTKHGLATRRVAAGHAFHGTVLAGLFDDPGPLLQVPLRHPRIPLWSATTGRRLTDDQATDPAFWASQPVAPVMFWAALDDVLRSGRYLLADVGPGQGLATLARRHPEVRLGRSAVSAVQPARLGSAEAERATVARWLSERAVEGLLCARDAALKRTPLDDRSSPAHG